MKVDLIDILNARDERYNMRKSIAEKTLVSLSLSLNIPGLPKSNKHINTFFVSIVEELKIYILSHRQSLLLSDSVLCCDADGDFFISPVLLSEIDVRAFKSLCEQFEMKHSLGRLIDVDVVDSMGNPVSSGKAKTCFLCEKKSAIECMREKNHSYEEIRTFIDDKIFTYTKAKYKSRLKRKLSSFATKALLHEVSLSPKPGLVDRFDSGSHSDMDYSTFLNSTAVLSVYFSDIVDYACSFSDKEMLNALPQLRTFGLEMERDMFEETNGVNTHKGAIFLLVFSVFISAYLKYRKNYSHDNFISLIKYLNKGVVSRELENMSGEGGKTHGEKCYSKFGTNAVGIRGEVEDGLPMVFKFSLKEISKELSKYRNITDKALNAALSRALLVIMSENNDTNILFRKGYDILNEFKNKSKKCLREKNLDKNYTELLDFCQAQKISPGGAADLLALSLYIFYVDRFIE